MPLKGQTKTSFETLPEINLASTAKYKNKKPQNFLLKIQKVLKVQKIRYPIVFFPPRIRNGLQRRTILIAAVDGPQHQQTGYTLSSISHHSSFLAHPFCRACLTTPSTTPPPWDGCSCPSRSTRGEGRRQSSSRSRTIFRCETSSHSDSLFSSSLPDISRFFL